MKTPKNSEVEYRKALQQVVKQLKLLTQNILVPELKRLEPEYVGDAYANFLSNAFERMRNALGNIDSIAQNIASSFVYKTSQMNKQRFYKSIENAIGIDMNRVIQRENLEDILLAKTRENINLIKTIPEEYFKKLETIVYSGTTQKSSATSMLKQIQNVGGVTENRAKLIARDQTSKLNSAITQQRQLNLGITEYVWITSGDERVRESHRSKNGKTFKWSEPPADTGHPGNDIQCRCIAQPIINI